MSDVAAWAQTVREALEYSRDYLREARIHARSKEAADALVALLLLERAATNGEEAERERAEIVEEGR